MAKFPSEQYRRSLVVWKKSVRGLEELVRIRPQKGWRMLSEPQMTIGCQFEPLPLLKLGLGPEYLVLVSQVPALAV